MHLLKSKYYQKASKYKCQKNSTIIQVTFRQDSKMNSNNRQAEHSRSISKIFPSKICPKTVSDNDNAILCYLCQTWVYTKCNHLKQMDYSYLVDFNDPQYCHLFYQFTLSLW